jgi:hypothetical protein
VQVKSMSSNTNWRLHTTTDCTRQMVSSTRRGVHLMTAHTTCHTRNRPPQWISALETPPPRWLWRETGSMFGLAAPKTPTVRYAMHVCSCNQHCFSLTDQPYQSTLTCIGDLAGSLLDADDMEGNFLVMSYETSSRVEYMCAVSVECLGTLVSENQSPSTFFCRDIKQLMVSTIYPSALTTTT